MLASCPVSTVNQNTPDSGIPTDSAQSHPALERGLSSESVTCGVEVVLALLRAEEIADFTDGAPEGVDGPDGAGSQKGLSMIAETGPHIFGE